MSRTDFDEVLVPGYRNTLGALANPHEPRPPIDLGDESKERLLAYLDGMYLIRATEEQIAAFATEGLAKTPCHLAIGQEAVPVAVGSHLRRTDRAFGGHRSHGHFLAMGGDLQGLLDEVLCRSTGVSGGRGGSMHICAPEVGFTGSVPLVGATIPVAVGAGLAARFDGRGDVAVAWFGDGASEEGVLHESLNLARVLSASVLFVCENNLFSSHLDIRLRQPADRVARYADAHHVPAETVDGNDVCAMSRTAGRLISEIREGGGPRFLEAVTYRFRGHVGPNEDIDVGLRRRMEDVRAWRSQDPILRLEQALFDAGLLDEDGRDRRKEALRTRVAEAAAVARTRPFPDPETLLDHVLHTTPREAR